MADIACWDLAIIFVENRREGACLLMVTTAYCSTCYLFYGFNKSKGNKTAIFFRPCIFSMEYDSPILLFRLCRGGGGGGGLLASGSEKERR